MFSLCCLLLFHNHPLRNLQFSCTLLWALGLKFWQIKIMWWWLFLLCKWVIMLCICHLTILNFVSFLVNVNLHCWLCRLFLVLRFRPNGAPVSTPAVYKGARSMPGSQQRTIKGGNLSYPQYFLSLPSNCPCGDTVVSHRWPSRWLASWNRTCLWPVWSSARWRSSTWVAMPWSATTASRNVASQAGSYHCQRWEAACGPPYGRAKISVRLSFTTKTCHSFS